MARPRRARWAREGLRSGLELRIKEWLDSKDRIDYGYEDRKVEYVVPESRHKYTPDFSLYRGRGDDREFVFAIEAKGAFPAKDRKKLLDVRRCNPQLDLRLMFQRDNHIRKGSPTRYSTWAEKNNFKYHVGETIPHEWLMELI